jgi:hypothetical protein
MFLLKAGLFSIFSFLIFHYVTSRPAEKILNDNKEEKPIVLAAKTFLESFTENKSK